MNKLGEVELKPWEEYLQKGVIALAAGIAIGFLINEIIVTIIFFW
jgi:hypothetical protein